MITGGFIVKQTDLKMMYEDIELELDSIPPADYDPGWASTEDYAILHLQEKVGMRRFRSHRA